MPATIMNPTPSPTDPEASHEFVIPRKKMLFFIHCATAAPSGHNTQPWTFTVKGDSIRIQPDFSRRLPVVDPDNRALYISLGCALENLVVAARHDGFDAETAYFPDPDDQYLEVALRRGGEEVDDALFEAIEKRQTNRREYDGRKIPEADLSRLRAVPLENGVKLRIFTEAWQIEELIDFVERANTEQWRDPAFKDELISWIRFNKSETEARFDGLTVEAQGSMMSVPHWLGGVIVKYLVGAEHESVRQEKLIRSSSALLLVESETDDKTAWIKTGRSYERVALTAAALGIRQGFLNQPIEVAHFRTELRHSGLFGNGYPQLLLRLGYAEPSPHSPRRPLTDVLICA